MTLDGVIGVGIGEDERGRPAIVVLTQREPDSGAIPPELEGRPIRVELVGTPRGGPPPGKEES
jgi:hypothetical protein